MANVSIHQRALLAFWLSSVSIFLLRKLVKFMNITMPVWTAPPAETEALVIIENGEISNAKEKQASPKNSSSQIKTVTFDTFTQNVALFGAIMYYYYLCDYEHHFPAAARVYSRDLFVFLILLLLVVSAVYTMKETADTILNRDQTEEWKGWMQVMFVWYHYFKAAETYNAIRIYIAAYVWMTGFGNFSFFWVRKDFSLYRVLKMLFRLNFLVIITCLVTRNEYMLYYICPMHTFWFISVYVFMRVLPSWNEDPKKMAIKFALYFSVVFLLFDVAGVGELVFTPLKFILEFKGSLHEWMFRAGLDHYATLLGMLCAYHHPNYVRLMTYLEAEQSDSKKRAFCLFVKYGIAGGLLVVSFLWYKHVFVLDKYPYNRLHPYFSFIPLLTYIYLRNLVPLFRQYYLHLFAWLGKITLETYISQLHIYMQNGAKDLIVYVSGYPLLNFALATVIYITLSYYLFHLTIAISSFVIPSDHTLMLQKVGVGSVWIGMCYLASLGFVSYV